MMAVYRNRANVEGKRTATAKAGDLEAMPPASKLVVTQEALVSEIRTPIPNVVHHASAQGLEPVEDESVGQNCCVV